MTGELADELHREAADFERHQQRRAQRRAETDDTTQAGTAKDPWEHDKRRYRLGIENIDVGARLRRPAEFLVVAALPGVGKTTLLEHSGIANALDGKSVVIATLEMTKPEIEASMLGRQLNVDLEGFERHRNGNSTAYQDALAKLQALPLRLYRPDDGESASIQRLFDVAERAKADMLLIDFTIMIDGWKPGTDARDIAKFIAKKTKATGMFVMLLAQLKTDLLAQKNRRPTMNDMEDTKSLNQFSTSMILVHRPFLGQPKKDVVAEIVVAKNRKSGPTFTGHVHWHGPTKSFYTMTAADESAAECCAPKGPPRSAAATALAAAEDEPSWPSEYDEPHPSMFDD